LDDQARTFVGQAANAVAIEFMQERVAAEVETRLRGELLGELISQNVSDRDELRKRAALLGHDLDGELRLIVVRPDDVSPDPEGPEPDVPLTMALADALGPGVPSPLLVARRGRGVALLTRPPRGSGQDGGDPLACATLRDRISTRLDCQVSLVAGSWVSHPSELAASYASIVRCLDAYRATGRRAFVVDFERSSFDRILVEVARSGEAAAFVESVIGPVLEYDLRRHGSLVESLEQYLAADSVLEAAARALHVHPHTLRYRLDRAAQLTGRSTSDPEAKLELLLALRLYRRLGADQASIRPTAG
jgi:sugar diacid utilization regulator